MQRRAADRQGMGDLKVGTVVHMRVEDVDRAKIDNHIRLFAKEAGRK